MKIRVFDGTLEVKNFSTECRRLSLKIHQLLCLWERMNNDH